MVNIISEGILSKLKSTFGQDTTIYMNKLEQGHKKPCFLITCISASSNKRIGGSIRNYTFDIHYLDGEKAGDIHSIANEMFESLEVINCDNSQIRGNKLNYKIEDDILHFFVDYSIHTVKAIEQERMGGFTVNNKISK